MATVAIVTAAGSAERFGGGKLLAEIEGAPLLERTLASLVDRMARVVVVVGPDAEELRRGVPSLAHPRVSVVVNPDPSRGMLSSIQEGLKTVDWADAYAVLPGDMPFVRSETVTALAEQFACSPGIVSPRYQGKRGHPVFVPSTLRGEILAEPPTSNLHEVLKRHPSARVDLDVDDAGVLRDIDTMEDLTQPPRVRLSDDESVPGGKAADAREPWGKAGT